MGTGKFLNRTSEVRFRNLPVPGIASDAASAQKLRRLQVQIFALTWLSYASYYLTRKNFSVVKARLHEDLGVSVGALGGIDTAYLAAYALGQFVNGMLGDRFGARRVISFGMLASAGVALLFGLSSHVVLFGVAFGVNGLFQSTGWPNNVKAMAPWFSRRSRGKIMGFWCTNYQVGGIVATGLATFLLVNVGWRTAFYVPAAWVALVGVVILFRLVERPQDRGLPPVEPEEVGATPPLERRSAPPLLRLLRIPTLWCLGGAYFGLKLIRYSLLFWLPFYLHNTLGYGEGTAGYLSTAFEGGGILGAVLVGWASDRFFPNHRGRLLVPMIFALAGALFLYQVVGAAGIVANATALALVGFLLFGPDALISGAAAQDIGGPDAAGSAAGFINGLGSIGAILQGIVTATVSERWGWDALFWVFVAFAILSGCTLLPLAFTKAPNERSTASP